MKKERIMFIISLIIMSVSSIVSAFAVNAYLYNASDVSYNNSSSGIKSETVEGAVNELYEHAADYNEMKSYFKNNPTSYFDGNGLQLGKTGTTHGWLDIYYNGVNSGNIYANSSGGISVRANNTSGANGQGTLALSGNPVTINGTAVGDLIKVKMARVTNNKLTKGMNLSSYVSIDSGYKFLCWQTVGASTGWTQSVPIYISQPLAVAGYPYWNGNLSTTASNVSVDFYYFEIKS